MSTSYTISICPFAQRHYLKNFARKYKAAWSITWRAICEEFSRFDSLLDTSIAEIIIENGDLKIAKTEFRIAGTKESRKSSGNRAIVAICHNLVSVLLIYHKSDLGDGNETAKWKNMIKDNYPEYRNMF